MLLRFLSLIAILFLIACKGKQTIYLIAPKNIVISTYDVVKMNGEKIGRVERLAIMRDSIRIALSINNYVDPISVKNIEIRDWGGLGSSVDFNGTFTDKKKTKDEIFFRLDSGSYKKRYE